MLALTPDEMDMLCHAPLFAGIGRSELLPLLDGATVTDYPEAGLLFSQGDQADRFFLVLAGRVNLFALTEAGDQSVIEVFDRGWTFAEAAIFSSGRFPLNAEVTAGARLLHIPAQPFLKRLSEHRELAFKMLAALSRRQRRMLSEIADLKSKSPGQRLGAFLLSLTGVEQGPATIGLPVTKTVLASRIGIAPESLSRAIGRLKAIGVESRGRDFIVADVSALRRFCEEGTTE